MICSVVPSLRGVCMGDGRSGFRSLNTSDSIAQGDKPRAVFVVGPTGVGKSDISMSLASHLNAEIISADSMQVYRYMDIGTAKPTAAQRRQRQHHLLDVVDPDGEFNVALFREHALAAMKEIWARGRNVLVVGGSGLYVKALARGLTRGVGRNVKFRASMERTISEKGLSFLFERLKRVDPDAGERIHPHDRVRIVRALEVLQSTGKSLKQWHQEHGFQDRPFDMLAVGLKRTRADLYERIDLRCCEMMEGGLLDEVAGLLEKGYSLALRSMQSVGYRQAGECLMGRLSQADALSSMQQATRRLARRQLTWFRGDDKLQWWHPDRMEDISELFSGFLGGSRVD